MHTSWIKPNSIWTCLLCSKTISSNLSEWWVKVHLSHM